MSDISRLVRWTVDHLPDGVDERRAVLNGLILVLPANEPSAAEVSDILDHLNRHLGAQREFAFTRGGGRLDSGTEQREAVPIGTQYHSGIGAGFSDNRPTKRPARGSGRLSDPTHPRGGAR